MQLHSHLSADEISVFIAVHLPVLLKHAVLCACTHEVEVTLAGGEAAADGGSRLAAAVATLTNQDRTRVNLLPTGSHDVPLEGRAKRWQRSWPLLPGGAPWRRHCAPAGGHCCPHTPLQTRGSSWCGPTRSGPSTATVLLPSIFKEIKK